MANRLTTEDKELIELLFEDNTPIEVIAKELGRHQQTIRNHLDRVGLRKIEHQEKETKEEQKEEQKEKQKEEPKKEKIRNFHINRGEIYYILKTSRKLLHEQEAGRPAIIVSNNKNNFYNYNVEVVFLTTQEKTPLPTHVTIYSSGKTSTALCEQVHTIPKERIAEYYGTCTEAEMEEIDAALCVSLDINPKKASAQTETKSEPQSECYEELLATFGQNAVFDYCRCSYFFQIFNNNKDEANKYLNAIAKYCKM